MTAAATFSALVLSAASCDKNNETDPGDTPVEYGTVRGVVVNEDAIAVEDATVTVAGTELIATSDIEGNFEIKNVPIAKQSIVVTKTGFADAQLSVNANNFKNMIADLGEITLSINGASITGKCINKDNAPYAGVSVTLNGADVVTTGEDGVYKFENLTRKDYTLLFQMAECEDITKTVKAADFTVQQNYVVTLPDVKMGAREILPGATADMLAMADVWHYNEYRGGKDGADLGYPYFDWSTSFLYTLKGFYGWKEEQREGTAIQIRNSPDEHQGNPVDMVNFDSYLAGRKKITEDNCKMYLKIRTHGATEASPVNFGVQVVDINAADPQAELVGGIRTYANDSYSNPDIEFDLTPYVGKEVVIAIGIFRAETGDYWRQLVIKRIAFAKENPGDRRFLPGTAVDGLDPGYQMTMEMLRSTMLLTEVSDFVGMNSEVKGKFIDNPWDAPENYRDAYQLFRENALFAGWWCSMPIAKDAEPHASEGFVIKTRGAGTPVSLDCPESYFYAKFAIGAGKNKLTFRTRNFHGTHATFFKVTAITEDGQVEHLQPIEHVADNAEAVENGAWKFIHENGGMDNPDDCATFKYDLSKYNGKNVVLAIGVFKGEDNGEECKLVINRVTLN